MSGNRPFISNFLAAFRAHSVTLATQPGTLTTPTAVISSAQAAWSSTAAYVPPRLDTRKTQSQPIKDSAPSSTGTTVTPTSTSGGQVAVPTSGTAIYYPPLQHAVSPLTHARGPPSPTTNPTRGRTLQQYPTCQEARRRRGSDTSSEGGYGFRETSKSATEKWYIGGRTAGGEERFYKLGLVRRDLSADRLSADRMSL